MLRYICVDRHIFYAMCKACCSSDDALHAEPASFKAAIDQGKDSFDTEPATFKAAID